MNNKPQILYSHTNSLLIVYGEIFVSNTLYGIYLLLSNQLPEFYGLSVIIVFSSLMLFFKRHDHISIDFYENGFKTYFPLLNDSYTFNYSDVTKVKSAYTIYDGFRLIFVARRPNGTICKFRLYFPSAQIFNFIKQNVIVEER